MNIHEQTVYRNLKHTHYFHPRYCCGDNLDQCGCYSDPYCGHFTTVVAAVFGNSDFADLL